MRIRYLALLALVLILIVTALSGGDPANYGLTGQVVDASGKGLSGVQVWIFERGGGVFNTTTNATGYYGSGVPPGNYTITVEIPGYSYTSSTAQVKAGAIAVAQNITGYPTAGYPASTASATAPAAIYQYGPAYAGGTGLVKGKIADQSGAGIPFASIMVDGLPTSTQTDEQGNYHITLSAGMHTIEPMKSGYGIPPRVVFVYSGQTTNFDMIGLRTISLGRGRQGI